MTQRSQPAIHHQGLWNFYEARDDEGSPRRDFVRLSLRLAVELGTGQAIGSIRKTTRLLLQPPSRRKLWRAQRTYCRRHNDSVLPSDPLSSLPPRPRARATLESGPARAVSILRAGRLRLVRWRSRTGPGGESVSGTCICCNPLQSLNHSVLAFCSLSLSLPPSLPLPLLTDRLRPRLAFTAASTPSLPQGAGPARAAAHIHRRACRTARLWPRARLRRHETRH